MDINIPEVLADLTATFRRYEPALLSNDRNSLNALFLRSSLVVRFGISENIYGHDQIANYRQTAGKVPDGKFYVKLSQHMEIISVLRMLNTYNLLQAVTAVNHKRGYELQTDGG